MSAQHTPVMSTTPNEREAGRLNVAVALLTECLGPLADAEKDVLAARRQLERANAKLGNIKGLKKPDARATEAQ